MGGDKSPDYSVALSNAFTSWLDSNKDSIYAIARASFDSGVEIIAAAIMTKVGKFLDENRAELLTATAAAIAAAYERRHFGEMHRMEGT